MSVLKQVLNKDNIFIIKDSNIKYNILLEQIIKQSLENKISPENIEKIKNSILEREKEHSTALPEGIALPHLKTNLVNKSFISLYILPNGIKTENDIVIYMIFFHVIPMDEFVFSLTLNSTFVKFFSSLNLEEVLSQEDIKQYILDKINNFEIDN